MQRRDRDLAEAVDGAIGRLFGSGEAQAVLERYGATAKPPGKGDSDAVRPGETKDPIAAGRLLFSTACSHCHGPEGGGRGMGGAIPSIRHYEGGQEKFRRIVENGDGAVQGDLDRGGNPQHLSIPHVTSPSTLSRLGRADR